MNKVAEVDNYIAQFPEDVQYRLNKLRTTIHKAAPDATEKISYKMPAYEMQGPLIYFAAYKNHIGVYPTPAGIKAFQKQLKPYVNAKGSVQFPFEMPFPYELIGKMVKLRMKQNKEKLKQKQKK